MATTVLSSTTTTTIGALPLMQNASQDGADDADSWVTTTCPRVVFLSVFLCFGFVGNLLLIITLCHARQFRSVYFFISIVNLAVVNISECLLNMSVLLTTSIQKTWSFGTIPCRLSAFFLHVVSVETILGLTMLTTDRMIAVRFKEKYDQVISYPRIYIVIFYTWMQAISFSFPIAVGVIPAAANDYIHYCSVSKGSSLVYSVFSTLFCLIIPLVIMVVFYVKIIRTGYKDRVLIRTLISQQHYKDDNVQEPRIKQEIRHTNLAGTLCVTWLLLEGPHVTTFYFAQFQESSELEDVGADELSYVWYVDMVLLWLRFSYPLALPIASFTWNKDLWKAFKDMILCRKNNAVVDESFGKHTDSETLSLERKIKEEKQKEKESLSHGREDRVFHVPVLFATARGVHIKTYDESNTDGEEDSDPGVAQDKLNMRGKKCDVIGSRDNLNNIGDDTSDYDSGNELDPFSVSHPISAKNLNHVNSMNRRRSSSQPEVRSDHVMNSKTEIHTFESPSNGDSGLDLSLGQNSSLLRKCQQNVTKDCSENDQSRQSVDKDSMKVLAKRDTADGDVENQVMNTQEINENENSYKQLPAVDSDQIINVKREPNYTVTKVTDSPSVRQKKKKHRHKAEDSNSPVSSSPLPPLRPPPRLAPLRTSDSVCSETLPETAVSRPQSPSSENTGDGVRVVNSDPTRVSHRIEEDLKLESNDTQSKVQPGHTCFHDELRPADGETRKTAGQFYNGVSDVNSHCVNQLALDCTRSADIYSEEVVSPSACRVSEKIAISAEEPSPSHENRAGYLALASDQGPDSQAIEAKTRNTEARRKRRERMLASPTSLLLDTKGYTRLMPDTP